jgi:hypothetical protein
MLTVIMVCVTVTVWGDAVVVRRVEVGVDQAGEQVVGAGAAGATRVVGLPAPWGGGRVEDGQSGGVQLTTEAAAGTGEVGLQPQAVGYPFAFLGGDRGGELDDGLADLTDQHVRVGTHQVGQQPSQQLVELLVDHGGGLAQHDADTA